MHRLYRKDIFLKFKNTIFYFGATAISFVISIGTYPMFAKYLDVTEFAAFNYFNSYSGFFAFFFSFNLYMFFSANYFSSKNDGAESLIKSLMSLLLVWNVVALAVAYLISVWILGSWLNVKFEIQNYLFFSLAAVSAGTLKSIFLIKLRLKKQASQYFVVSCISRIFATLLGLGLVVYFEASAKSRFIGVLAAELFTSLLIYLLVFKDGGFRLPVNEIKKIFRFVWPLLLSSIVYYPLIGMDQMVLERYVSKQELGLYSIGLNFAGYLHTFNFSIFQTIEPDLIRFKSTNNNTGLKKQLKLLISIAVFTTTIFCLLSKEIISILSHNKFTAAYTVTNILCVSYIFVLLFSVGNTLLTVEQKGKQVLVSNVVGLCSILILSLLLHNFGSKGIAWARVISFVILALITFTLTFGFVRMKKLFKTKFFSSLSYLSVRSN
jgi:O-antigen/teichoic acid export membrane protein